jgi:hypothetical protein
MQDDSSETPSQEPFRESASRLIADWRVILSRLVEEAETFTREKPGVGLAAALFAGTLLGSFFRRR